MPTSVVGGDAGHILTVKAPEADESLCERGILRSVYLSDTLLGTVELLDFGIGERAIVDADVLNYTVMLTIIAT